MLHKTGRCWCGDRHTTGQRFELNIASGEQWAPVPDDETTEIAREYEAQETEAGDG
jgi:hypothetical protein